VIESGVLADPNAEELRSLADDITAELAPASPVEGELVRHAVIEAVRGRQIESWHRDALESIPIFDPADHEALTAEGALKAVVAADWSSALAARAAAAVEIMDRLGRSRDPRECQLVAEELIALTGLEEVEGWTDHLTPKDPKEWRAVIRRILQYLSIGKTEAMEVLAAKAEQLEVEAAAGAAMIRRWRTRTIVDNGLIDNYQRVQRHNRESFVGALRSLASYRKMNE
jgi:hypothetical protein